MRPTSASRAVPGQGAHPRSRRPHRAWATDQRDSELHDILCVRAEMMLGQYVAKKQTEQRPAENTRKCYASNLYRTQSLFSLR